MHSSVTTDPQLVSLTELYLSDCFLDFLPANFGRLAKLRILELRENSLTSLPKSMARLVSIVRLDLSQNQFSEVPDVLTAMTELEELWLDGNKLRSLPPFLGTLPALRHLDASFNHLEVVAPELGHCLALQDLTLSSNDLSVLPESLDNLTSLVTLKVDDNQLERLPANLGRMAALEELFAAENFLTSLPPSIGWLRRLHTLNVDENDLEDLPPEVGSCKALKILSAHGNKLQSLPGELGHIAHLAVLNLAGNSIPHLPVSFVKLKAITAIWLANNQTKPLVQLNHDTDPYTGQKVLTNFLLPQQAELDRDADNTSESGSFHASVWEEERSKRSLVKWAGEEALDLEKTGSLRRAPTPFPKEMRAMAKKAMSLREKSRAEEAAKEGRGRRNRGGEHRGRGSRQRERGQEVGREGEATPAQGSQEDAKAAATPTPVNVWAPESRRSPDKVSRDSGVTSPSEGGSVTTDTSEQAHDSLDSQTTTTHVLSVHSTPASGLTVQAAPVQAGAGRRPSDPLPHAPATPRHQPPVKAELVTTELDDEPTGIRHQVTNVLTLQDLKQNAQVPPPYHIAAARSKQLGNFNPMRQRPISEEDEEQRKRKEEEEEKRKRREEEEEHYYENQESMKQRRPIAGQALERKASFLSDGTFDSISESEASTAPSSLQTIVRAPYSIGGLSQYGALSECDSDEESQGTPAPPEQGSHLSSASALRKVSEQLLSTSRTRASLSAPLTPRAPAPLADSRPSSIALPPGARPPGPPSLGQSSSSSSQGSSRPPSQLSRPSSTQPSRLPSFSPSPAGPHQSRLPSYSPSPSTPSSRLPTLASSAPNTLGLPSPAPQVLPHVLTTTCLQVRSVANRAVSPSHPNPPYSPALAIPSR